MTASSIFLMLMTGLIYTFLFALHLHETTATKLGASDDARKALINLTDEIRSATRIKIGSGDPGKFVEVGTNAPQTGASIQIFPDSNTNDWICYYYETNTGSANYAKLCRTESANLGGSTAIVAHSITNSTSLFTCEDSYGDILGGDQNNRVIGVTLKFYQIEYPVVKIGPGNYYDFYQLHTRVTRRRLY
jgi:hypothetical protein